jgi:hypothetical protein
MPAPASRRVRARLYDVEAIAREDARGVWLRFRPERSRIITEPIEHFADLGPEWCIPAVGGLGSVMRVLKAARLAMPADNDAFIGEPERVAELLKRALDVCVWLDLKPRSHVSFTVWTDDGVETIDNVRHVVETDNAYEVVRTPGHLPKLFMRDDIVRQQTDCARWYEVTDIERAT